MIKVAIGVCCESGQVKVDGGNENLGEDMFWTSGRFGDARYGHTFSLGKAKRCAAGLCLLW